MAVRSVRQGGQEFPLNQGEDLGATALWFNPDTNQWEDWSTTGCKLGPFGGFCRSESLGFWNSRIVLHLRIPCESFTQEFSEGVVTLEPPEGKHIRGLFLKTLDLQGFEVRIVTQPSIGELCAYNERMPYFES